MSPDPRPKPNSKKTLSRSPRLSVVVCTHDRYDLLPGAINSLLGQQVAPEFLEIIVIDNSTDKAAALRFSRRLADERRVRYLIEPTPGLSNARNLGVAHSRSDLVAFIDDDAIAAPDWAAQIVRAFESSVSHVGVVGGRVLLRWVRERPQWLGDDLLGYLSLIDWGGPTRELGPCEGLAGCNIAFKKNVLISAGGFSRTLGRIGLSLRSNEEVEVMEKIRDSGFKLIYCPEAVVEHLIDSARLTHCWIRRRAAWQAVSECMKDPKKFEAFASMADFHLKLVHKDGSRPGPLGFFGKTMDANEFSQDVALIYDLVIALLHGGAELPQCGYELVHK